MKKMIIGLVCTIGAMVSFATPKASWVPANADMVAVLGQEPTAVKAAQQIWLDALTAAGLDLNALVKQSMEDDQKDCVEICNLIMADKADAITTTYTSIVCSIVLPKEIAAFMGSDPNAAKEFEIYMFIENPKLDIKALTTKIEKLLEEKKDEVTLSRKDAWYVMTEVKDTNKTDEPQAIIAFRQIPTGMLWALGCAPTIIEKADGLDAGTVASIDPKSPLQKAFAQDIVKPQVSKGTFIIGDVASLIKRAITDTETLADIEMRAPMLLKTKTVQWTTDTDTKATIATTITAQLEDPGMAEQLRDLLLGFRAMGGIAMGADPKMADIAKFLNTIKVTSANAETSLALTITPESGIKLYKAIKAMVEEAMQPRPYCAPMEFEPDEALEEMTDEEAEALLKSL